MKPDLTDSEKAELDEFLEERHHQRWSDARTARRWAAFRAWSHWLSAIVALLATFRDDIANLWHNLTSHIK